MKFCCVGYKSNLNENKNDRTSRISVEFDENEKARFYLEIRSVMSSDQKKLNTDIPIAIVTRVQIQYCPWCGKKVEKFYKKNIKEFKREKYESQIPSE